MRVKWRFALCLLLYLPISSELAAQSLALVSDINGRYGSTQYNARVAKAIAQITVGDVDAVLSTGDMVAGQKSSLGDDQIKDMWTAFHQEVSIPLDKAGIPLLVTPGNHDGSALPGFSRDRAEFDVQWQSQKPVFPLLPNSNWPRNYALWIDDMLVVALDGTRPGPLPDKQFQWLRQTLQAHGEKAQLTVVISHLPLWPMTQGREREIIDDAELLNLMHSQGVDILASGHHHAFYAGTDSAGMVHLSVGALGGNVRTLVGSDTKQKHSFSMLSFDHDLIYISAVQAPGFTTSIEIESLPEVIDGPLGRLQRINGSVPLRSMQ